MRKSLLAVALLCTAISGRADQLLPTGEGTSWEYDSTETVTGAAPVHSTVTVRAGKQLLDGKEVAKLETLTNNVVSKTELVSVDEKGVVCLARSGKDGKIAKLNPPAPIIAAPLKVGGAWETEGEVAGTKMHQRFTVLAEENVIVPAGKFRAFHLQSKDSSLMSTTLDRWFVPGTGFVKETTMVRGPGVMQGTTLELNKITNAPARPVAATSPAKPTPAAPSPSSAPQVVVATSPAAPAAPSPSSAPQVVVATSSAAPPPEPAASPEENTPPPKKLTVEVSNDPAGGLKTHFKSDVVNIYVRWHGHDLPEGARIRVAWVAEDVGDLVEPNFVIDETESVAQGPNASARFTLGRPPDGWAEGKYRVEFYVDDLPVETVPIVISK